jgi:hypothetical protein
MILAIWDWKHDDYNFEASPEKEKNSNSKTKGLGAQLK